MTAKPAYLYGLSPDEVVRLDDLARQRGAYWRKRGVGTKKMGLNWSDLDIDRMGCYGEYACCQMLGIPFNWRHDRRDGGIDGLFHGKTVQIKATPVGNRLLLFTNMEHFETDLAILTLVDMDLKVVQMAGWVRHAEFEAWHTFDHVKTYLEKQPFLDRDWLHPPETLVSSLIRPQGDVLSLPEVRAARSAARARERDQQERERRAIRAEADRVKRAWIEAGYEMRQPPEYRGRVWSHADHDGVHPSAFPPMRPNAQEPPSEEFLAFQVHNQTRYETHPQYYCVDCKIRYNARDGGRCGPCIGKDQPSQGRYGHRPPPPPEYPI